MIITTNSAALGLYDLNLTAEGIDEGETVTHELPITLDISGFELSSSNRSKTIKQLETAEFDISLDSINDYEGEAALSIEGLPYGIRASLDRTTVQVPGDATLTIQSSKYVKPGIYTFSIIGDDGLVIHGMELSLTINSNAGISAGIIATPGISKHLEQKVRSPS